jgi:hypothetical protein
MWEFWYNRGMRDITTILAFLSVVVKKKDRRQPILFFHT